MRPARFLAAYSAIPIIQICSFTRFVRGRVSTSRQRDTCDCPNADSDMIMWQVPVDNVFYQDIAVTQRMAGVSEQLENAVPISRRRRTGFSAEISGSHSTPVIKQLLYPYFTAPSLTTANYHIISAHHRFATSPCGELAVRRYPALVQYEFREAPLYATLKVDAVRREWPSTYSTQCWEQPTKTPP